MSTATMAAADLPTAIVARIESQIQVYKADLFDHMEHGVIDANLAKSLVAAQRAILTKKELEKHGVKAGKAKVPNQVVSANATANYNIAAQDIAQPIANTITATNNVDQNLGIPADDLGIQHSTDWHNDSSVNNSHDFSFNDYNTFSPSFNQDLGGCSAPVNEATQEQVNVKTPAKVTQVANPSAPVITGVSCRKADHTHTWPTEGQLVIERCEHRCLICISQHAPKADHEWSSAWYLRRHIRDVHGKDFPLLVVAEGWKARPNGNTRPEIKAPRVPGSNKKKAGTKKDKARAEAARKRGEAFLSSPSQHDSSHSFGLGQVATQPDQAVAHDLYARLSAYKNNHADANVASIDTEQVTAQQDQAFAYDLQARLSAYNNSHADANAASNATEQVAIQPVQTSDEDLHARLSAYLANSNANDANAAVFDIEAQPHYIEDADMAGYTQVTSTVDYSSNVEPQLDSFTSAPTDTTSSHNESTISSFDNGFETSQYNDQPASSFTSFSEYDEPVKNYPPATQAEMNALFAPMPSETQAIRDQDMSNADTLFVQDTTADQVVDHCHLSDVDTSAAIAAPFEVSDANEQNDLSLPATINDQAGHQIDTSAAITPAFEATNTKELSTLLNYGGVDFSDMLLEEQLNKYNNSYETHADANQFGYLPVMSTSNSSTMSPAQIQEESFANDVYFTTGDTLYSEKELNQAYPGSPSPEACTAKKSAAIEQAVADPADIDPRMAFDFPAEPVASNIYNDDSTSFGEYLQTQLHDIYSELGISNMFDFVAYNNS